MKKRIIVLGAGPAGLALAVKLLRRRDRNWEILVVEEEAYVGGIAASFQADGLYFDFGSHRLHPATTTEIMQDLTDLLGPDLLNRPRNGRIRLLDSFVKYPLNPLDLIIHLPPSFVGGFVRDLLTIAFKKKCTFHRSFADATLEGLGKTVCEAFYFPYAQKLWGKKPEDISIIQAERRIAANSLFKVIKKMLSLLPGFRKGNTGRFFYPRRGFGQISRAWANEFDRLGGRMLLSTTAEEVRIDFNRPAAIKLRTVRDQKNESSFCQEIPCDFVFSTIPLTTLAKIMRPVPPAQITEAYRNLKYRGMILVYLIIETDQFTPYDAHYLPQENVSMSRLSEPKNYSAASMPKGRTGLCAEIPCNVGDELWNLSDEELTRKVLLELEQIDLPVKCGIKRSFSKRLRFVYPIYDQDFNVRFEILNEFFDKFSGLVTLGRQGLFAHDNTHHTIEMAYRASECLDKDLNWDADAWHKYRQVFALHVVED